MVAERWEVEDLAAVVRAEYAMVLARLYERIAYRFGRAEVQARVRRLCWPGSPSYAPLVMCMTVPTWLLQIAANALVEQIRREKRMILVDDTSLRAIVDDCALTELMDPAQWVERWEDADRLQRQVAALSVDQRTVVRLRYWDDLSPRDIAATMGRSEASTRQLLHRSLVTLRQTIEDSAEDDRPRAAGAIDQRRQHHRRHSGAPSIGSRPADAPESAG